MHMMLVINIIYDIIRVPAMWSHGRFPPTAALCQTSLKMYQVTLN